MYYIAVEVSTLRTINIDRDNELLKYKVKVETLENILQTANSDNNRLKDDIRSLRIELQAANDRNRQTRLEFDILKDRQYSQETEKKVLHMLSNSNQGHFLGIKTQPHENEKNRHENENILPHEKVSLYDLKNRGDIRKISEQNCDAEIILSNNKDFISTVLSSNSTLIKSTAASEAKKWSNKNNNNSNNNKETKKPFYYQETRSRSLSPSTRTSASTNVLRNSTNSSLLNDNKNDVIDSSSKREVDRSLGIAEKGFRKF